MSGHSKWSKIKRKKEANDAKKATVFTKFSSELAHAAKQGGPDPAANATLRDVIDRAKKAGVPQANIDRLLDKNSSENTQTATYEGFGPAGAGIIVVAATDNTNRTVAEIRKIFTASGGSLGGPNSVMWNFTKQEDTFTPNHVKELSAADKQKLADLITELQSHPDVTSVHTNAA